MQEEGVIGFVCFSSKKYFSLPLSLTSPQFACVDIPTRLIHVSMIDVMNQTKDILGKNTFAVRRNAEIFFPSFYSILIKRSALVGGTKNILIKILLLF